MIIFLVGLSGAGKTTIAQELCKIWKVSYPNTVILDGDTVRDFFPVDSIDADYSIERRRANALRINSICKWLDSQGINVICSVLSIFPDLRGDLRACTKQYFEVYIDVPVETLISRDNKGLYRGALKGEIKNVVGIDIDFPVPKTADMTVGNDFEIETAIDTACSILEKALAAPDTLIN